MKEDPFEINLVLGEGGGRDLTEPQWAKGEMRRTRTIFYPETEWLDETHTIGKYRRTSVHLEKWRSRSTFLAGVSVGWEEQIRPKRLARDSRAVIELRNGTTILHRFSAPGIAVRCHNWLRIGWSGELPVTAFELYTGFVCKGRPTPGVDC